jgi:sec-independent protein translocase protein TatB
MSVFDFGFAEVLIVLLVALLVIGPERLPPMVRAAGLMVGKAKASLAEVRQELERELPTEEIAELKAMGRRVSNVKRRKIVPGLDTTAGLQNEP